jgi:serine/threonine protein kinase
MKIITEIATGGMGIVYQAKDTHTNQIVAIKQLKASETAFSPELITRFQREGEALRELDHPNIVKMLDMVQDDSGESYLVVEYIAGGDLQNLLNNQRLSVQECLEIALELADALTRAHHLKIIHRDLKPANVLLADDGTPRLTDFWGGTY